MHRDLKLSNILVTNENIIKLCDYGLARKESVLVKPSERTYTNNVITLWYRPPELLFGATNYNASVDIWSVGCILGELLLGKVLFKGSTHMARDNRGVDKARTNSSQMAKIFMITGSPTLATWPNHDKLPDYVKIMKATKGKLGVDTNFIQSKMEETWEGVLSDDAYDAVRRMLVLDPSKRTTASQAMKLPFFNPRRGGFDEKLLHAATFPPLFQHGCSNHEWEIRHGGEAANASHGAHANNIKSNLNPSAERVPGNGARNSNYAGGGDFSREAWNGGAGRGGNRPFDEHCNNNDNNNRNYGRYNDRGAPDNGRHGERRDNRVYNGYQNPQQNPHASPSESSAHHRRDDGPRGDRRDYDAGANYRHGYGRNNGDDQFSRRNPVEHGHSNRNRYDRDAPYDNRGRHHRSNAPHYQHDRMDRPPNAPRFQDVGDRGPPHGPPPPKRDPAPPPPSRSFEGRDGPGRKREEHWHHDHQGRNRSGPRGHNPRYGGESYGSQRKGNRGGGKRRNKGGKEGKGRNSKKRRWNDSKSR